MSPISRAVRFVCTDKGQHSEHALALVVPYAARADRTDMTPDPAALSRGWAVAESLTRRDAGGDPHTWHRESAEIVSGTLHVPRCPSCKRELRITSAQIHALATQLTPDRAGRVRVDISC